jgi:hypothetical protein
MIELDNTAGTASTWVIPYTPGVYDVVPTFSGGDTLAAVVWAGENQAKLLTLAAPTWAVMATGSTTVSIATGQTSGFDNAGNYSLQITRTAASQTMVLATCLLKILPSPGPGTDATLCYCQYDDLLLYGNWITLLQSQTDQESYYDQRLQAREWMDWAILNNYRGSSVGMFEDASLSAFAFGGGVGNRRSVGPSPSMITYLAANDLILRPQIVRACAYKAISYIGLNQIGISNQYAALGAYFKAMADIEALSTTAELDLDGDGLGEIFVNLGSTNTLAT